MVTLGNSPARELVIRLEARKSFSLGVWITDVNENPLDITGTTLRLVVKKDPERTPDLDDSENLIVNSEAAIEAPEQGFARFSLQASDLHHRPGEYPFSMVLWDDGYSSVIARGVIDIVSNTEFLSIEDTYTVDDGVIASALRITMRNRDVLKVMTGSTITPGQHPFTNAERSKLAGIEEGAQANPPDYMLIPDGGLYGTHLIREEDGSTGWAYPYSVDGGFVHTGVIPDVNDPGFFVPGGSVVTDGSGSFGAPAGYVPTSNGIGYWNWEPVAAVDPGPQPGEYVSSVNGMSDIVNLTLDNVPATPTKLTLTPAERASIATIGTAATTAEWSKVTGKPTNLLYKAGVDAATDVTSGVLSNARVPVVSALRGFSSGTAEPVNSSGADGDLYFQYE